MNIFLQQTKFPEFSRPTGKNPEVSKVAGLVFKSSHITVLAYKVSSLRYFKK